jgi:uncharacterized membrane protein
MSRVLSDFVALEINAPVEKCYAAMIDFESYPKWQKAICESNILEKTSFGLTVEFIADVIIKKFRYVLAYRFSREKEFAFAWELVEGDIENVTGDFTLKTLKNPAKCIATYRLDLIPGFWVPKTLVYLVKKNVMMGVLKDLKKWVE